MTCAIICSIEQWRIVSELGALAAVSAIISAGIIVALRPVLTRYALARPNARSSHSNPTPQGGGIAVIAATIISVASGVIIVPNLAAEPIHLAVILAVVIGIAVVGATDDVRPMEALPRLVLQSMAVLIVIGTLPTDMRILPVLPWWIERALLVIGSVWFVNLVNFMDGIDWMTVAEVVPVTIGLVVIGILDALPSDGMIMAIALCGALIGFAPFNRPVARLFLGDVGSLPIGLLIAWLLILVAGRGYITAAILLPLYYVADTTITLLRRLMNGEPITQAHRSHFYQRAMDSGFSVNQIVGHVFVVNIILVGLAFLSVLNTSRTFNVAAITGGSALVGALLWKFNRAYR